MTANNNPDLSRRAVLGGLFALGVVAVGYTVMPHVVFAQPAPDNAFLALSEFLTGKKLDARLAARYRAALAKHDPKFEIAAATLQRFLADAKAADVDALIALPTLDPALRKTITAIVSAWYLGIVGDGADVELISYAEAVMYRPTAGALVIPTYGGGPGSWGPKPVVATEGLQ